MGICEDEAFIRREQETVCREILNKLNIGYHISVFETGAELWAAFSKGERYDLLLLDIVMDETNGMEIARKIRARDNAAAIVFITSNPDYALQGYDVKALHYLMKPLDAAALEKLIDADYQNRFYNQFFIIKSGAQNFRVLIKDVVCLENTGRYVLITTTDGTVEYSGKLSDLMRELPGNAVVRCHVGYAVNMRHMRELTRTDAIAMNGKHIPVSRAYSKAVQKAFLKQMWEG